MFNCHFEVLFQTLIGRFNKAWFFTQRLPRSFMLLSLFFFSWFIMVWAAVDTPHHFNTSRQRIKQWERDSGYHIYQSLLFTAGLGSIYFTHVHSTSQGARRKRQLLRRCGKLRGFGHGSAWLLSIIDTMVSLHHQSLACTMCY